MIFDFLRYDVFISYAREDTEFVRELVAFLEAEEFHPFWDRDRESIQPGAPWLRKIEEVLSEGIPGIVVLSPDALESRVASMERDMLLTQGEDRLVIPLLYRDVPYTGAIATLQWLDVRNPEEREQAFQELASRLRKTTTPPRSETNGHRPINLSLRKVLAACLVASVGSVLLASLLFSGCRTYRFKKIQEIQREVQAIDRGLLGIRSQAEEEAEVYINSSGFVQGKDYWQGNRLLTRRLYVQGRLVALDEFMYSPSSPLPVGKVRSYLDEAQNVVLMDEFAQDGSLIRKRACPDGPERPCDVYMDDMRSPMPPPSLFLSYR